MTADEIKRRLVSHLAKIASDVDVGTIDENADLRDELDIDSLDFLRFMKAIKEDLGVAVPEEDYAKVRSLAGAAAYVAAKKA